MSYVKTSRTIRSPKYAERMRKQRLALLFLALICLVTVTASAILLLRASFFQIKSITVEGATLTSPSALEATALASLDGSYFHTIPHSNVLFFSKKSLNESIFEKFKEVQDFTVHRKGISGLRLSIVERQPAAIVCAGFRDEVEENCYWSDNEGYIFAAVATTSSVTEIINRYYVPTDKTTLTTGAHFVSSERFKELQKFVKGTSVGGLIPLGVLVGENGEYELYVKNMSGDSEVTIYFDDRAPFSDTLENLLTFWQNTAQNKKTTSTPIFDYINLRFGNTVYYSAQ